MKRKQTWIVFFLDGKELASYTLEGTFLGELKSTRELLAYENDVPASSICFAVINR